MACTDVSVRHERVRIERLQQHISRRKEPKSDLNLHLLDARASLETVFAFSSLCAYRPNTATKFRALRAASARSMDVVCISTSSDDEAKEAQAPILLSLILKCSLRINLGIFTGIRKRQRESVKNARHAALMR